GSYVESLTETALRLHIVFGRARQQQPSLEPIQLRCPPIVRHAVAYRERLRDHLQPFLYLAHVPQRLGQQGKISYTPLCPCAAPVGLFLAELRDPCIPLSQLDQCPAS